jgi:hypothetical protein
MRQYDTRGRPIRALACYAARCASDKILSPRACIKAAAREVNKAGSHDRSSRLVARENPKGIARLLTRTRRGTLPAQKRLSRCVVPKSVALILTAIFERDCKRNIHQS